VSILSYLPNNFISAFISIIFNFRQNLEQHKLVHLDENTLHKCNECEKSFKWKCYLRKHKLCHSEVNSLKCADCGKTFITRRNLDYHIVTHEASRKNNLMKYKCDECESTFSNKIHFRKHQITHMPYYVR